MAPKAQAGGGKDAAPKDAGRKGKGGPPNKEGGASRDEKLNAALAAIAAKEPQKPDRASHEAELKRLRERHTVLMKQKDDIYEARKVRAEERKEANNQIKSEVESSMPTDARSALIAKKKELREEIEKGHTALNETKEAMKEYTAQIRNERRSVDDSAAKQYRNVGQVNQAIKDLELELECGGGSVNKERRLQGEIRTLKQIKSQMQDKNKQENSVKGLQGQVDASKASMDAAWANLQELRAKMKDIDAELDQLSKERAEKIKELQSEKNANAPQLEDDGLDAVKAQLKKVRDEMDSSRDKYRAIQVAHSKWWDESKKARDEAWAAQRAAREAEKKKWEEEKKAREAEKKEASLRRERERRLNPKADEIQMCVTLIDFLCRGQKAEKAKEANKEAKSFDASAKAPVMSGKKLVVMTGKKTENDSSFAFPKKKKAKADVPAPTTAASAKVKVPAQVAGAPKKPLKLMMQQTHAFNKVGVPVPNYSDQVPETVELLQKKKVEFEGKRRSEAEVDKEMAEEAAKAAKEAEAKAAEEKAEQEAAKAKEAEAEAAAAAE